MRFCILGSGSAGNCSVLDTGRTRLLIDAGFSGLQIRRRLESIGLRPEDLDGILLTHEHGDHTAGLGTLCGKLNLPLYCNRLTASALRADLPAFANWKIFQTGQPFAINELTIENFPIPHDAADPVGFVVHASTHALGFLTDLGHATHLVVERVRQCHTLVLESNYDPQLLQDDPKRPWQVKQRIMSRHGHLSNEGAAKVVDTILSERLTRLYLGHLSADCNRPALAASSVGEILNRAGAGHVQVEVARQETPTTAVALTE